MKNLFTLFTIILVTTTIVFAQNNEDVLYTGAKESKGLIWVQDSLYFYNWNETEYEYYFDDVVLERDERGNATAVLRRGIHYITQTEENISQTEYEYDENDNLTLRMSLTWNLDEEIWDTSYVTTNIYDINGNLISNEYIKPNSPSNSYRRFYTYDSNNNETSVHEQDWDDNAQIWLNDYKGTNTYDENNYKTHQLYQEWDITNSLWVNIQQFTIDYDIPSGIETERLKETWDTDLNVWVNNYLETRAIDGNTVTYTYKEWDTDLEVWLNETQNIYEYETVPGNILSYISYNWDTDLSNWVYSSKYTREFNENDNLTHT